MRLPHPTPPHQEALWPLPNPTGSESPKVRRVQALMRETDRAIASHRSILGTRRQPQGQPNPRSHAASHPPMQRGAPRRPPLASRLPLADTRCCPISHQAPLLQQRSTTFPPGLEPHKEGAAAPPPVWRSLRQPPLPMLWGLSFCLCARAEYRLSARCCRAGSPGVLRCRVGSQSALPALWPRAPSSRGSYHLRCRSGV